MAEDRIDENGLPVYAPGDYDFVRVVDRSTGASRNALAPDVTAAARALSAALDQVVADAQGDIDAILTGLGYLPAVPYEAGLSVATNRFSVEHNGNLYAPLPSAVPFTSGADFNPAQWKMIVQGAFQQSGAGAVIRTMHDKAREVVSPGDYTGVTVPVLDVRIGSDGTNWGVVLGKASQPAQNIGRGSVVVGGYIDSRVHRLPGSQELRCIVGGYDCEIDDGPGTGGLACAIFGSHHSEISGASTHATVVGGSYAAITGGDYNGVFAGTTNEIQANCKYSVILGGQDNKILDGGSEVTSGFRSAIFAGGSNSVKSRNSSIFGGLGCTIESSGYSTVISGEQVHISGGNYNVAAGNSVNLSGAYAFAHGFNLEVHAQHSFAHGRLHVIDATIAYASARGVGCVPPTPASHVFSGRQRGNVAGRNQGLDFTCSAETTGTTVERLRVFSSFPAMPENSVVNGSFYVTGVNTANGDVSTYEIAVTVRRIGAANPTVVHSDVVERTNGLALGTAPSINVTSGGVYRVQVVGLAETSIAWDARFVGQQVVFTP